MYMQPGAPAGMYTGPGGMMNGFMQQQQQMPAMGQNMAMPQQVSDCVFSLGFLHTLH